MEVRPIAGALGAEVVGIDLSHDLPPATVAAIKRAFLDHLVLFFRDQDLSSDAFMRVSAMFGQPVDYPFLKGLDGYPHIAPVVKLPHQTVNFGGNWHADTTYFEHPPMASLLVARELPPFGGDTQFANQYLAYETLSEGMRSLLSRLRGVSRSDKAEASRTREDRQTAERTVMAADHPVVRTHPETGRKSLFVNLAHTAHFVGMTEAESMPLLRYLFAHQVRPEFTCRFQWSPGALAIWDNRCSLHSALNDYQGHKRVMHRVTLAGDRPV